MEHTLQQYNKVLAECTSVFVKKMKDYGPSWRIFRVGSLADQIFIKANRIRTLQEVKESRVGEDTRGEWVGIVNYSIIALIQIELGYSAQPDISGETAAELYTKYAAEARDLMTRKNHDYGEAWRDMRIASFTDLILVKLARIRQIGDNDGQTIASEGIDANFYDIINYALFALIKLDEGV